jgi:spore coat protein CotH
MRLKVLISFLHKSTSKILFLFTIGIVLLLSLQLASCNSKKKKKKVKPIVYSLAQYPLTTYYLTLNQDSLDYINENFKENIYIEVTLEVDGRKMKGAKMRIRGDSSRKLPKKSFKIQLPKGKKLKDGAKKVNLNADYGDKTMIHQYLASKTMNDYNQLCFRSGFVPVYINGEYYGLYLRVENIDAPFLKSRNLNTNDNLYKASKDYSCLVNKNEVDNKWEKKTNKKGDNDDLKDFITELNEIPIVDFESFAKKRLFYDEIINIISLNMLLSNSSTYYHNYYMYHDLEKDKWRMLPWDMDKTFNIDHIGYNYQKTSWSEGKSSAMNTNTLVEKILANRNTLQSVRERIVQIQTSFGLEDFKKEVDTLRKQLKTYVLDDSTNKIGTEEKWNSNLEKLLLYMDERPDNILRQIDNKPINFMVDREVKVDGNTAFISWEKSIDPNGLPITYSIHYALKNDFKDNNGKIIDGLKETHGKIENLASGKYFFYIAASNNEFTTYGHDIRNYFVIP